MKSVLWSPVRVIFVKTIKICYMSKKSIRIYQNWLLEFMPCLKLYNWCFLSTSPLLSFCAWYRCKYNPVVQICCYSDMKHIFGRQARRSFCSPYRCKNNYPFSSHHLIFCQKYCFHRNDLILNYATFQMISKTCSEMAWTLGLAVSEAER